MIGTSTFMHCATPAQRGTDTIEKPIAAVPSSKHVCCDKWLLIHILLVLHPRPDRDLGLLHVRSAELRHGRRAAAKPVRCTPASVTQTHAVFFKSSCPSPCCGFGVSFATRKQSCKLDTWTASRCARLRSSEHVSGAPAKGVRNSTCSGMASPWAATAELPKAGVDAAERQVATRSKPRRDQDARSR